MKQFTNDEVRGLLQVLGTLTFWAVSVISVISIQFPGAAPAQLVSGLLAILGLSYPVYRWFSRAWGAILKEFLK